MKRLAWAMVLVLFLGGCDDTPKEVQRGMDLRAAILQAEQCRFLADITADYGDKIQQFSLDCQTDRQGNLTFSVVKPESISAISGQISDEGGKLTFADTALYFELLTDEQINPVSAPWIFMKALRGGYLRSACVEEKLLHLTINDTYEEDALTLDIWLEDGEKPVRGEILQDGRRILTLDVKEFAIS